MPIIQVNLFEGRTMEQKRTLVAEMTQAVVKSLGCKSEDVRIILNDMAKHDFAVAGVLVADRQG
jgi:4-oxalocrotonate tautomerase